MKFRTDFITNSSSSSYLTFNIKNKRLFEALTKIGIKFNKAEDGEFSDRTEIELPSGKKAVIGGLDDIWELPDLPYITDTESISAWLVAVILYVVEWVTDPPNGEEEYSDFAKELIDLFNKAGITHLDWDAVETWSWGGVIADCEKAFGEMDADIEDADIEYMHGSEGEGDKCLYTGVKDGTRMDVAYYGSSEEIETEDCRGLEFVVVGEMKFFKGRDGIVKYIEEVGGSVTDGVSKDTDYLICDNIRSDSFEMKKAKELGIAVLSEAAFIRRFANPEDFDGIKEEESLGREAWELTWEGNVLDFVFNNGTQPIVTEVWKNGKWTRNISDHKIAAQKAAQAAKAEAAKNIMASVWAADNGRLKRLLLIPERNCLSTTDPAYTKQLDSVSYDALCDQGYFRFGDAPIDSQETPDCFVCVEKETRKNFIGEEVNHLIFTVVCKNTIADMDDFRVRHIETCSVLNEMINGKELAGFGKTYYSACRTDIISDDSVSCTIWFNDNDYTYTRTGGTNVLAKYAVDSGVIVRKLLDDNAFHDAMMIKEESDAELYSRGYFEMHESFKQNSEKGFRTWIMVAWDFANDISVTVVPVCRADSRETENGEDRFAIMRERVKSVLNGLETPDGEELEFEEAYSRDDMKLSDELSVAMIRFKKSAKEFRNI